MTHEILLIGTAHRQLQRRPRNNSSQVALDSTVNRPHVVFLGALIGPRQRIAVERTGELLRPGIRLRRITGAQRIGTDTTQPMTDQVLLVVTGHRELQRRSARDGSQEALDTPVDRADEILRCALIGPRQRIAVERTGERNSIDRARYRHGACKQRRLRHRVGRCAEGATDLVGRSRIALRAEVQTASARVERHAGEFGAGLTLEAKEWE